MKPLNAQKIETYYVDWLTYAPGIAKSESLGLGAYIAQCYDLDGEVDLLEAGNDTDYSYGIISEPIDEYNMKYVEELLKHKGVEHWKLSTVLTDLCNKGLLEPGEYVVKVSW